MADEERRSYVRVDDRLPLSYEEAATDSPLPAGEPLQEPLGRIRKAMKLLDPEFQTALGQLNNESLRNALSVLDKKIELLAERVGEADAEAMTMPAERPVNISASGIAFPTERALDKGTALDLDFKLPTHGVWLRLRAQVVVCEQASEAVREEGYAYLVRTDFTVVSDSDEEMLIQHVIQREAQWLRERRRQRDQGDDG